MRESAQYLTGTFEKSPVEIAGQCAAHLLSSERCAEIATQ
jgi:hypothetical protein